MSVRLLGWGCGLVLIAWSLVSGGSARAQASPLVLLAQVSEQEQGEQVADALRSQLIDMDCPLEVVWTTSLGVGPVRDMEEARAALVEWPNALAVVWLTRAQTGLHLHLLDARGAEPAVRSVADMPAFAENVALIVRGFVGSLRAPTAPGPVVAASEPEVARVETRLETTGEPEPAPASPLISQRRLLLGMGWRGIWVSPHAGDSHGLLVSADFDWSEHWSVGVDYAFMANIETSSAEQLVTLNRHPLSLGLQGRFGEGPGQLGAGLAIGVDFVSEIVFSVREERRKHDLDHRVFFVTPTLLGRYRLAPRVWVELEAGTEVGFLDAASGEPLKDGLLTTLSPFRPVAHASLAFALE